MYFQVLWLQSFIFLQQNDMQTKQHICGVDLTFICKIFAQWEWKIKKLISYLRHMIFDL